MRPQLATTVAVAAASAALAAAAACSASNNACFRACPAMGGQWQVTFEPATDPAECQKLGVTVPDGVLDIQQQTSALTATFEGEALDGTAYDTGQFALDGLANPDGGGIDSFSFRGAWQGGGDAGTDGGGDLLSGTYDATLQRPGPQGTVTCRLVRDYTAARR